MTDQPKPTFSDFTARAEAEATQRYGDSDVSYRIAAEREGFISGAQFGYDEARREIEDVPPNNRDAAMTPPILGGDHGEEPSSIPAQRTSLPAEGGTSRDLELDAIEARAKKAVEGRPVNEGRIKDAMACTSFFVEKDEQCNYTYPVAISSDAPGPRCSKLRSQHPLPRRDAITPALQPYLHTEFVEIMDLCESCGVQQAHPIHDPEFGGTHGFKALGYTLPSEENPNA